MHGLKKSILLLKVLSFIILFSQPSMSVEISGKEIIKRMDRLLWSETSQGYYEMKIITPHWERTLKLRVFEKHRQKTFIRILSPPKERGVATLRIGYEMWNYLPSVERIIKIPPSMMLQAWMGSDFTNDDLVKESSIVNDYHHRRLAIERINGFSAYKVEALPKEDAPVVWGRILYWVRTGDFVPLREEFYNEKGELIRVLTFSDIREMDGRTIPTRWEMVPLKKKGRKTILRIIEIRFDSPIDDSIFTLRNLKSQDWR